MWNMLVNFMEWCEICYSIREFWLLLRTVTSSSGVSGKIEVQMIPAYASMKTLSRWDSYYQWTILSDWINNKRCTYLPTSEQRT